MAKGVPEEEGGWERVEQDPIYKDLMVIFLAGALGLILYMRGQIRLPEGSTSIGMTLTCTAFIAILVCFLAFMMWTIRQVRSDAIRRSVALPWKRVTQGLEEVLEERGIEFDAEVRRWRGPSYNWAFGTFRQVYRMPPTDLRIYIESKDPKGTRVGGSPTEVSMGRVTDGNRELVDRLKGLLDELITGLHDG